MLCTLDNALAGAVLCTLDNALAGAVLCTLDNALAGAAAVHGIESMTSRDIIR